MVLYDRVRFTIVNSNDSIKIKTIARTFRMSSNMQRISLCALLEPEPDPLRRVRKVELEEIHYMFVLSMYASYNRRIRRLQSVHVRILCICENRGKHSHITYLLHLLAYIIYGWYLDFKTVLHLQKDATEFIHFASLFTAHRRRFI